MATSRLPQDQILHRTPWFLPFLTAISLVGGVVALTLASKTLPPVRTAIVRAVERGNEFELLGWFALGVVALLAAIEQARRFNRSKPPLALFLRVNRASAYGIGLTFGWLCLHLAGNGAAWLRLVESSDEQGKLAALAMGLSLLSYVVIVHPFRKEKPDDLVPFPLHIGSQRESHAYTLGIRHIDDWEHATVGSRDWSVWPESGTYGNLLCLGQIGSGKTSQIADPLFLQALLKFPNDDAKQPSLVVFDLKGNQCVRYWQWANSLGRGQSFWVLRPDYVAGGGDEQIPRDRYVSLNVLGGWEETDLLAIEFQEALESTKDRPSPDYFRTVQQEFLVHAFRLFTAANIEPDLADIQAFGSSMETRAALLESSASSSASPAVEDSRRYFREEFGRLSPQDQASLLRGLAAQLTLLTNNAIQDAFCPKRSKAGRRLFEGWGREILERPGIIVFSCPPSKFTDSLSRLLGLLVLKGFQQAMLTRCDASFSGNRSRPVILLIDEAHAFLNKRIGDFMSVSRESRVSTWLLTQSLSQIPRDYRGIVLSNTRTRIVLSVSDETAAEMSKVLGEVTETQESASYSESLQGAADQALREKKTGRSKGISATRTFAERTRPRWTPHAMQHLAPFRAIAHVFDGEKQRESELIETAPWYRLPYYLLNPLEHPNVRCTNGIHSYKQKDNGLVCSTCGHALSGWALSDYKFSKAALDRFMTAIAAKQKAS